MHEGSTHQPRQLHTLEGHCMPSTASAPHAGLLASPLAQQPKMGLRSLARSHAQQHACSATQGGLAQDLERRVAAEHGPGVWRMLPWFLPPPSTDQDVVRCLTGQGMPIHDRRRFGIATMVVEPRARDGGWWSGDASFRSHRSWMHSLGVCSRSAAASYARLGAGG